MISGQNFVFLIFRDPFVVGVVNYLRRAMGAKVDDRLPHVTIQGPFSEPISSERICSIQKILAADVFLIANVDFFDTPKGVALFFRVNSQNLARVWNKPDYPKDRFGIQPHLTMYEGPDRDRVMRAAKFLKREPLEVVTTVVDVVPYVSKQFELFPEAGVPPDEMVIQRLIALGKIGSSFDSRFRSALRGSLDP